ncbi:hypothetical protein RJ640_011686 [Escallonia rubra]|uniref:Uncharacterized protein n=1 Tax=Escallonia rubra TaxID=112253 RepID=A0AA88R808_9ASTE|nr:hypothetical protein RJ640_011686 [Escallonia rubra]
MFVELVHYLWFPATFCRKAIPKVDFLLASTLESLHINQQDSIQICLSISLFYAEEENTYAPHDKIVDCITSCIHVARLSDILDQRQNVLHVFLVSLAPEITWTVKMSVFTSIKILCSRLQGNLTGSEESSQHASVGSLVHELFLSVSPKVVECIGTVKIAQVLIID